MISVLKNFINNLTVGDQNEYDELDEVVVDKATDKLNYGFDEEEDDYDMEQEQSKFKFFPSNKSKSARKDDYLSVRMQIIKPSHYEDAKEIIRLLKEKQSIVMNLEYISKEEGRRIIDIVSGGVTALDGQIVKVTNAIFIAAPANYMIEGEKEKRRKTFNF